MPERAVEHLVDLIRLRLLERPEETGLVFLDDGESESHRLTRAEVDRRARAIAAVLGPHRGERAVLLYAPSVDYVCAFLGCLYAGVIAVPAYPPDPNRILRTLPRLVSLTKDADASIVLTSTPIRQFAEMLFDQAPELRDRRWITTDDLRPGEEEAWTLPAIEPDDVAFLQYTSGSTAAPRGVMVTHRNLLANLALIRHAMQLGRDSVCVSWLPPYHDMGLIGGILTPLTLGAALVLMPPMAFLQRPLRWLIAISRYRATLSGGPNFAFDLCVRKSSPEARAALDLSSLRVMYNGAEPVRLHTLRRFVEAFAPSGFDARMFYPCYGLAEGTLIVSGASPDEAYASTSVDREALSRNEVTVGEESDPDAVVLVSAGRTILDQIIAIVDPSTGTLAGAGKVGEIWVSGPSVARGYFRRPEVSKELFEAKLDGFGERAFLRTGDLGFLHERELYVTGRLKDLIIVRGRNLYPQDIELTAELAHPALRPGSSAAFSIEHDGDERLVVAVEVERRSPAARGRAARPGPPPAGGSARRGEGACPARPAHDRRRDPRRGRRSTPAPAPRRHPAPGRRLAEDLEREGAADRDARGLPERRARRRRGGGGSPREHAPAGRAPRSRDRA
jgi:acyl-CoA synthetase (AMP-forming)/AMP-acid ligase II